MSYATRITNLKPEGAYQVLARANQLESEGREIIHLEIGQPDYATFENVSEAGIAAIRPVIPVTHRQRECRLCAKQSPGTADSGAA